MSIILYDGKTSYTPLSGEWAIETIIILNIIKQKMKRYLLPLLVLLCTIRISQAAVTMLVRVSGQPNTTHTTQAATGTNSYSNNPTITAGTYTGFVANVRITALAEDGVTPAQIMRIDDLDFKVSSSTTSGSTTFFGLPLDYVFNDEVSGDDPIFRAYDVSGNDITVSAGLLGQGIGSNMNNKGVYEVRGTDFQASLLTGPTYSINAPGDTLSVTVEGSLRVQGNASAATGTNSVTLTVVPEPTQFILGIVAGSVFLFRRRRL